jgi:hypothetical protein
MSENGNIGGSATMWDSTVELTVNDRTVIDAFALLLSKVKAWPTCTAEDIRWIDTAIHALTLLPLAAGPAPLPCLLCYISWPLKSSALPGLRYRTNAMFDEAGVVLFFGHESQCENGEPKIRTLMSWFADDNESTELQEVYFDQDRVPGFLPFHAAVEALDVASCGELLCEFNTGEPDSEIPLPQLHVAGMGPRSQTAEEYLHDLIDEAKGRKLNIERYAAPERCDICACDFDRGELLVDGRLRDSITFADMCPRCACLYGSGIGYGDGQLYLRQPDDSWLCVAGFPPEDSIDTQ